jgi:hypothetical protein
MSTETRGHDGTMRLFFYKVIKSAKMKGHQFVYLHKGSPAGKRLSATVLNHSVFLYGLFGDCGRYCVHR